MSLAKYQLAGIIFYTRHVHKNEEKNETNVVIYFIFIISRLIYAILSRLK